MSKYRIVESGIFVGKDGNFVKIYDIQKRILGIWFSIHTDMLEKHAYAILEVITKKPIIEVRV